MEDGLLSCRERRFWRSRKMAEELEQEAQAKITGAGVCALDAKWPDSRTPRAWLSATTHALEQWRAHEAEAELSIQLAAL